MALHLPPDVLLSDKEAEEKQHITVFCEQTKCWNLLVKLIISRSYLTLTSSEVLACGSG